MIPGIVAWRRAGGFTGPLDLVSGALVAYSCARALSAAWLGQPLVRLRKASGGEMTFNADATTGLFPDADYIAWDPADTSFVVTTFDQSGNGKDRTNATAATQPIFVRSANNSLPGYRSTNTQFLKSANVTMNPPLTIFVVAGGANIGGTAFYADNGDGSNFVWMKLNTVDVDTRAVDGLDTGESAGGNFSWASDGEYRVHEAVINFGANLLLIDGVNQSGTNAYDDTQNPTLGGIPVYFGSAEGGALSGFFGTTHEEIVWASALSAGNRALVRSNQITAFNL